MSQYPGGQPPQDPYYGRPPSEAWGPPPPQPSDPYLGQPPADPYAVPPPPPGEPWYGQPPVDPSVQQAQYQAWYGQQQGAWPPPQSPQQPPAAPASTRTGGGAGAAIAGIFLVLLGVWFLFREEISLDIGRVWPVVAVALGILMVIAAFIPRRSG